MTEPQAPPVQERPGARIGPYQLLQQIGEGGFGVVFLAEQEQPVARKVALKIIKLGMDTRQVVARFEQERQALAMMDHPNIAKVFDAGATDTGRPYFVMELVNGCPIVEYCDQNRLTIDERLQLFAQICHAIQHAHGKGIIHRDLKPTNVLVATQDGRAHAKVIDFGIAKATSKVTDKTVFTEHRQVIGTFRYMSPEQAQGSLDLDTRTDVYSLGVLLYELLTGSTPVDEETIQGAMYGEIQRLIREVEPPRPSTRITESRDRLASIAAQRRVEPRRLSTLVRGELDWIVMKAIEKDRGRRYGTADALAMDIARYLAGEAVVAAPPGAAYRLRTLVRRHRGVFASAAAIALALLLGLIASLWQARIAQDERDQAVKATAAEAEARKAEASQRVVAERNARTAAALNQFLLDMLGSADLRAFGREARVSQALDRAAADVGSAFVDRPEVEAAVRRMLGRTYLSLGMLEEAGPQVEAALSLDQRVHGEQSIEFARSVGNRAGLQLLRGEHGVAAVGLRKAAELAEKAGGPEDPLTLDLRTDYANALVALGRMTDGETILRELLDTRIRVLGRDASGTQIAFNSLAVLLHEAGRIDEAEPLYREAVEIGERALGADHPDTLTARLNLGSLLRSKSRLAEAEPLMAAAYQGIRKTFGEGHARTADAARILARLYVDLGRFREALPLCEEVVAIRRRVEGDDSVPVAHARQALAHVHGRLLNHDRAIAAQEQAVAALNAPGSAAPADDALYSRLQLANLLVAADRSPPAVALFQELLVAIPRALGEDHATTTIANNSYAVLLMGEERFAEALPYLQKALATGRRIDGENHRSTVITLLNLAATTRDLGRLEEALGLGRECLERFPRVFGPQHPNTARAQGNHAMTLALLGRKEEARRGFTAALATANASGERSSEATWLRTELGRLLLDLGELDAAEPLLREAVEILTQVRGSKDFRTANAQVELGRCLALRQQFAPAEPLLADGHQALVTARPAGRRDIRRAERYLAALFAAWNAAAPDPARAAKAAQWQAKVDAAR